MLRLPGLFCTSLFLNVTVELGCSNHVENNVFMGLIDLFYFSMKIHSSSSLVLSVESLSLLTVCPHL